MFIYLYIFTLTFSKVFSSKHEVGILYILGRGGKSENRAAMFIYLYIFTLTLSKVFSSKHEVGTLYILGRGGKSENRAARRGSLTCLVDTMESVQVGSFTTETSTT